MARKKKETTDVIATVANITSPSPEEVKAVVTGAKPKKPRKPKAPKEPKAPKAAKTAKAAVQPEPVVTADVVGTAETSAPQVARFTVTDIEFNGETYSEVIDVSEPSSYVKYGKKSYENMREATKVVIMALRETLDYADTLIDDLSTDIPDITNFDFASLRKRRGILDIFRSDPRVDFGDFMGWVGGADDRGFMDMALTEAKRLLKAAGALRRPIENFDELVSLVAVFEKLLEPMVWLSKRQSVAEIGVFSARRQLLCDIINSFNMLSQDKHRHSFSMAYGQYTKHLTDMITLLTGYSGDLARIVDELAHKNHDQVVVFADMAASKRNQIVTEMADLRAAKDDLRATFTELLKNIALWDSTHPTV